MKVYPRVDQFEAMQWTGDNTEQVRDWLHGLLKPERPEDIGGYDSRVDYPDDKYPTFGWYCCDDHHTDLGRFIVLAKRGEHWQVHEESMTEGWFSREFKVA